MTPNDKRDRRKARHEVEKRAKRLIRRRMGLYSTGPQIRQFTRQYVDGYFSMIEEMQQSATVTAIPPLDE